MPESNPCAARARSLPTRNGSVALPAYIPVTTFGATFPLDDLVRPFLPRLAPAMLVSPHYARDEQALAMRPALPLYVDSGGFASLLPNARIVERDGLGTIVVDAPGGADAPLADAIGGTEAIEPNEITPLSVLELQERIADVAFTLDFPTPAARVGEEGELRLRLTVANALWALANRRRRDMPLLACVQGWDVASYVRCAQAYRGAGFDGLAIGGLVPRASDRALVLEIVRAVRLIEPNAVLHVFGIGAPELVREIFAAGADSVDSSAYVRMAADGRAWGSSARLADPSPMRRMQLAVDNLATASQRALPLGSAQIRFRSWLTESA